MAMCKQALVDPPSHAHNYLSNGRRILDFLRCIWGEDWVSNAELATNLLL